MRHHARVLVWTVLLGVAATLLPVGAPIALTTARTIELATSIGLAAMPTVGATRLTVSTTRDAVSVSRSGPMTPELIATVESIGASLGIPTARGRAFNIGLNAVRRGDRVVQQAAGTSGQWQYPMSVTALPIEAITSVMSIAVSTAVGQGGVVLSATSAGLRGAQAGDVVDLVASDGGLRSFVLGYIAPDTEVGGAELVMSPDQADALGAGVVTRVLMYGVTDRGQLDDRLTAGGIIDGTTVRVSRSWWPRNPDGVLGSVRTKVLMGEFDYRVNSDDSLTLDPDWVAANIVRVDYTSIGIRASCHRAITAGIQAALDEIAAAGLGGAIDLGNTNTYGGCYNPRYARVSGVIGSVSRHAWGMAIDMNTVTNAQGRTPQMDCRVVRIFRKHGFAWGGNFLVPDGMHFEWVGEARNALPYPSEYCPNVTSGGIESVPELAPEPVPELAPGETEGAVMFAGDGWFLVHTGDTDDHR